jgi:hypothetical protein
MLHKNIALELLIDLEIMSKMTLSHERFYMDDKGRITEIHFNRAYSGKDISDEVIANFCTKNHMHLKHMYLFNIYGSQAVQLKNIEFLKLLPALRIIDAGKSNLSAASIKRIKKQFPYIEIKI